MKNNLRPQHYLILCFCLGLFVSYLSNNLSERWKLRPQLVERELALPHGGAENPLIKVYPEIHNRILFALFLEQFSKRLTFFTPSRWYGALRILSAVLMFIVFWRSLAALGATDEQMLLGLGLLAYVVICACELKYEYPADFLDPLFITLIVRYALQRKHAWLVGVTLLGCLNRESAVFAGVVWLCLYAYRKRWHYKELAFGFGLAAVAYLLVLSVRYGLAGWDAFRQVQSFTLGFLAYFFQSLYLYPTSTYSWFTLQILVFAVPLLFLWAQRANLTETHRRLLVAALLITGATLTLATLVEVRIMLPTLTILAWTAATSFNLRPPMDTEGTRLKSTDECK